MSSDWIATKASGPKSLVGHFDEFIYSAQIMQTKESDQLRLDHNQGLSFQSLVGHFDEFSYSAQVMQPKQLIISGWIATKASAPRP